MELSHVELNERKVSNGSNLSAKSRLEVELNRVVSRHDFAGSVPRGIDLVPLALAIFPSLLLLQK